MREAEIIALLSQKDPQGAESLLKHFGPLMCYVIRPILPNAQDQEECLSEVVLRIMDKIHLYNPDRGSWKAWITAITRSVALNKARANSHLPEAEELTAQTPSPEHILEDLAEEEILACKGALAVVTDVCDHSVDTGHEVQEQIGNTIHIYTEYPEKELRITGVGVALPGEKTQWKLFHHFQWLSAPHFWGTDVIQLWPAYNNGKGWLPAGDVTGRILCDDGKQIFSAPYYELGSETYTSNTIFWGEQTSTDLFASFSMPKDKQNYRGYVSYAVTPAQEGWLVDAWINYTHQISWLQFPAITAKEKHLITGVSDTHAFTCDRCTS